MLTGNSPFRTASEYLTFNVILAHCDGSEPLAYPDSIGGPARDVIGRLLAADPATRLGAGAEGTDSDFAALRNHPFFQCEERENAILWGRLLEQTAPFVPDPATFPSTTSMRDGADDEWLSDGEATPIAYNPIAYKKGGKGSGHSPEHVNAELISMPIPILAPTKSTDKGRYWDQYLTLGEEHVFGGIVWKRKVI
jgi:hypothetical protein